MRRFASARPDQRRPERVAGDNGIPLAGEDNRVKSAGRVLVPLVVLVLAAAAFLGYRGDLGDGWRGAQTVTLVTPPPEPPPVDPAAVAAAVQPALVNIEVAARPFGAGAAGTGIVIGADGEVLTSHHVVKGAEDVTVTDVGNGRSYDATVLGYDSGTDIAVLTLRGATGLTTARLGTSADLRIRQEVLAIGNAGGTGGTPTAVHGRISGLNSTIVAVNAADRTRKALTGMVEISAPVVAGQSGGAMADGTGAVVGVITAASGEADPAAAPKPPNGYAVPIDTAMRVVQQIRSGTPSENVHVGPTATLGVLVSDAKPAGARIDLALYGQPAYSAGLKEGEVITAIDGKSVTTARALRAAINVRAPGETIRLTIRGPDGVQRPVRVELATGTPN